MKGILVGVVGMTMPTLHPKKCVAVAVGATRVQHQLRLSWAAICATLGIRGSPAAVANQMGMLR